ncbi:hypothetical protein VC178_08215 [Polynucleobacter sp. AP-Sanab-80-C2]|uniref:hypothetical protein n=1 Tax=Polynucleobacter sp. AP-Sanab-80-C2 TaxID=3108274 RepID=UPI002B23B8B8|nr:hypothetical protein [Polynucleobacter sp. AP-Sanab-80-C2]MEA9599870.1 hypothetical protein [Polynucleobacter sp. AP-Sanab-80-C2]
MQYLITLLLIAQAVLLARGVSAQAIYGPNGNYVGYSQTSPSGVTNVYNSTGQNVQSFQTDNGQTNFYSPQGAYQGASTTPVYAAPNSTINAPRQAPQAPSVKGW